jgi:hypothetical protein
VPVPEQEFLNGFLQQSFKVDDRGPLPSPKSIKFVAGRAEEQLSWPSAFYQKGLSHSRRDVKEANFPPRRLGYNIFITDDLFWRSIWRTRLNEKKRFAQNT